MSRTCRGSIIRRMTRIAIGGRSGVCTVLVTAGARGRSMGSGQREIGRIMIERGGSPPIHRMTGKTIVIELIGNMARIRDTVEIGEVTGVTIRCGPFELTVLVTIVTRHRSM